MTLYEHELKNAYIGDVYDMQIDFRGKTLAQLQDLWWAETKYNANCWLSYWADGVQVYRASWNYGVWWVYIQLPRAITANDKITMIFTGVWWSWDTNWRLFVSLADQPTVSLASSTQIETDYSICVWSNNSPQWITCQKSVNWTKTWDVFTLSRDKSWSSWNVAWECILDLPNNKVSWNCTAPSSQVYSMEWTITTDWKNCIIWTNYFIVWAWCYVASINHKLQTAEIIIES